MPILTSYSCALKLSPVTGPAGASEEEADSELCCAEEEEAEAELCSEEEEELTCSEELESTDSEVSEDEAEDSTEEAPLETSDIEEAEEGSPLSDELKTEDSEGFCEEIELFWLEIADELSVVPAQERSAKLDRRRMLVFTFMIIPLGVGGGPVN